MRAGGSAGGDGRAAGYRRGVSLAVVFLPDTALLVPGAAGRADPAAGLRDAAVAALADLARQDGPAAGRLLVIAPARRDRFLPHPVAPGLGAAGLDLPHRAPAAGGAVRADTPASVALVLLRAAGAGAPVDVLEIDRATTAADAIAAATATATAAHAGGAPGVPRALIVVGSLSARHGPDAPLPEDPRAPAVDEALLDGLAGGPDALARALDHLGPGGARDLAVSGWAPWRAALALLAADAGPGPEPAAVHAEVLAGAQHAVAAWPPAGPAARTRPAPHPTEEPR